VTPFATVNGPTDIALSVAATVILELNVLECVFTGLRPELPALSAAKLKLPDPSVFKTWFADPSAVG
jgi:hypothetical protein